MKKFFNSYYEYFKFWKFFHHQNEINKLSDLVNLIEKNELDLSKHLLLSKISDYNYANIYLKSDQVEIKKLPLHHNTSTTSFDEENRNESSININNKIIINRKFKI